MRDKAPSRMLREFEAVLGRRATGRAPPVSPEGDRTVIANPARRRLYVYLFSHPCSHFNRICTDLRMKYPTAKWHMQKLLDGKFVEEKLLRDRKLFAPEGMVADGDTEMVSFMGSGKGRVSFLIMHLAGKPGSTKGEISLALDIAPQAAGRIISRGVRLGILKPVRDGRFSRLYLGGSLPKKHRQYKKRERWLANMIAAKMKADGISVDVIRIGSGRAVMRVSFGGKSDVATFSLNPIGPFVPLKN